MFSGRMTTTSTADCSAEIIRLKNALDASDWKMTAKNPNAVYACINKGEALCPEEISEQSICLNMDIGAAVKKIL